MVKTYGAIDKKLRKTRKDKGKKRKKYRGKPVKGKRKRRFPKVQGHKEYIKIWIWKLEPMSVEGYLRWNKKRRLRINKTTYVPLKNAVHIVHVSEINSKEKIEKWMEEHYWGGTDGRKNTYWIKGFSHGKNKYHITNKRMCEVTVRDTPEGNKAQMTKSFRLHRYWFWNK
jgi:hypothetical protein